MSTPPPPPPLLRPGTLREVVRFATIHGKGSRAYLLAGFLDDFYLDQSKEGRQRRLAETAELTGDRQFDALIGAIGEHLCHRWALGSPPAWTEHPDRFLHEPWFLGPERFKPFLLAESPSAYRRRFIFAEAEPLRRATMPRDGRWWAYEKLRTGMEPGEPGDIAPPSIPRARVVSAP